jgi:hypothetical protein
MPRLGLRKLVGERLIVIDTNKLHPLHRALRNMLDGHHDVVEFAVVGSVEAPCQVLQGEALVVEVGDQVGGGFEEVAEEDS